MKTTTTTFTLSVFAMAIALAAGSAHAATLVSGGTDHLVAGDVNDDYVISVNANNSGYANTFSASSNAAFVGTTINESFNGSIEGYRFVNVTGTPGNRTLTTVVESGGIVAQMTSTDEDDNDGFDSFGQNALDGYTITDPGANLLAPTGANDFTAGIRDLSDFSGTVDISGITEGSIYLFYGQYNAGGGLSLTATMSGTALSDISTANLFSGVSPVGNQNIFVTRMDFVNDLGYETISYTSNGSRLVGLVVTNTIPEPSTAILAGLGLAGLCLRRRRR